MYGGLYNVPDEFDIQDFRAHCDCVEVVLQKPMTVKWAQIIFNGFKEEGGDQENDYIFRGNFKGLMEDLNQVYLSIYRILSLLVGLKL